MTFFPSSIYSWSQTLKDNVNIQNLGEEKKIKASCKIAFNMY